jgi:hypothetical protein
VTDSLDRFPRKLLHSNPAAPVLPVVIECELLPLSRPRSRLVCFSRSYDPVAHPETYDGCAIVALLPAYGVYSDGCKYREGPGVLPIDAGIADGSLVTKGTRTRFSFVRTVCGATSLVVTAEPTAGATAFAKGGVTTGVAKGFWPASAVPDEGTALATTVPLA